MAPSPLKALLVLGGSSLALAFADVLEGSQHPLNGATEPWLPEEEPQALVDHQDANLAKIRLFPGSRVPPHDLAAQHKEQSEACPANEPTSAVEIGLNTCLSAEYYARDNIRVEEIPQCDDPATLTVSFYPRRFCGGEPSIVRKGDEVDSLKDVCLWSATEVPKPSYYWSLVFRCGDAQGETAPEMKHAEAIPPSIKHQALGGVTGSLASYMGISRCGGQDDRGTGWAWATDECRWTYTAFPPFHHIKITNPPVCVNGTRARLALYQDNGLSDRYYNCNNQVMTFKEGIRDINDEDIGKCIPVQNLELIDGLGSARTANAKGIKFHCEGEPPATLPPPPIDDSKKEEDPKPQTPTTGLVSHTFCAPQPAYPYTQQQSNELAANHPPTTFFPVEPDTCVDVPATQRLHLKGVPTCPDGTAARLATWSTVSCKGLPDRVAGAKAGLGAYCKDYGRRGQAWSYSFICGGEEDPLATSNADGRGIYSVDACPRKDGFRSVEWTEGLAPALVRKERDSCVYVSGGTDWMVTASAVCDGGRAAKLAIWEGNSDCRGQPNKMVDVSGELGRCMNVCGTKEGDYWYKCSAAFWCEGVKRSGRW